MTLLEGAITVSTTTVKQFNIVKVFLVLESKFKCKAISNTLTH